MSKCRPGATAKLQSLEQFGVTLSDVSTTVKTASGDKDLRQVIITIPYEALRDEKDVQLAFQDLVVISSTP